MLSGYEEIWVWISALWLGHLLGCMFMEMKGGWMHEHMAIGSMNCRRGSLRQG